LRLQWGGGRRSAVCGADRKSAKVQCSWYNGCHIRTLWRVQGSRLETVMRLESAQSVDATKCPALMSGWSPNYWPPVASTASLPHWTAEYVHTYQSVLDGTLAPAPVSTMCSGHTTDYLSSTPPCLADHIYVFLSGGTPSGGCIRSEELHRRRRVDGGCSISHATSWVPDSS